MEVYEDDWASLEGVTAFAAFARPDRRRVLARLLVRWQSIYQYTDTLMEQPSSDQAANARRLHMAIVLALQPARPQIDYYADDTHGEDGGYLAELVDGCRGMLAGLPSYPVVSEAVLGQVGGIVHYQSRINLAREQDFPALERWGERESPAGATLRWWELAAASGSSLCTLALLAAAADPDLTCTSAGAIEALYWPWMGALHTLLDSLIDRAEDTRTTQHNLLDHYSSPREMTERMERLAAETVRRAGGVGVEHRLILAGVVSLYLSDPQAWLPHARETTERVMAALGGLARPAMTILRARRLAHRGGRAARAAHARRPAAG